MATASKTVDLLKLVDDRATEYVLIKAEIEDLKDALDKKKAELLKLVSKHGVIPAGAEKSKRVEGDQYIVTASFGTSSSVNSDAVTGVRAQLCAEGKLSVFDKLFQSHTSYLVSPEAPLTVKGLSAAVRRLFKKVVTTKPKEPSLKVERRKK